MNIDPQARIEKLWRVVLPTKSRRHILKFTQKSRGAIEVAGFYGQYSEANLRVLCFLA